MNSSLFIILGIVLIGISAAALITGKVMAGSRGLKPNYYSRTDNPGMYYTFVVLYFCIGLFVITSSL